MILADTSALIVLGRLNKLGILEALFGEVGIPQAVYDEAVTKSNLVAQKEAILQAIQQGYLVVFEAVATDVPFRRSLGAGEQGVLTLAHEIKAKAIIMDDRKARREATEMGFRLIYTLSVLRLAAERGVCEPLPTVLNQLAAMGIYLRD